MLRSFAALRDSDVKAWRNLFSYVHIEFCNYIVANEMPDSLATMTKNRSNILFYAILADKMAFSLATMNFNNNAVAMAFPMPFPWIEL